MHLTIDAQVSLNYSRIGPLGSNSYRLTIDTTTLPPIATPNGLGTPGYKFFWNFGDGTYRMYQTNLGADVPPVIHNYPIHPIPGFQYKPKVKVTLIYSADKDPLATAQRTLPPIDSLHRPVKPMAISLGDSLLRVDATREPVPDELVTFILNYKDTAQSGSGQVTYYWDSDMAFDTIEFYHGEELLTPITQDSIGPATIVWEYNGMDSNEVRNVFITFRTQDLPTSEAGDTIVVESRIGNFRQQVVKDTALYQFRIYPSHDPNGKVVTPDTFYQNVETLTYTIKFQNEGMGPAKHIQVIDEISPLLDFSSLQVEYVRVAQGEAKDIDIDPTYFGFKYKLDKDPSNRLVSWTFDPVYLMGTQDPDGYLGELMTSGEIRYSIKTECVMDTGTLIPNRAEIIFDGNPMKTNVAWALKACCMAEVSYERQVGYFNLKDYITDLEGDIDPYSIHILSVYSKENSEYPPELDDSQLPVLAYYPNRKFSGMDAITYKACNTAGECKEFTLYICVNLREGSYPCDRKDCTRSNGPIDVSNNPWVKAYPNPFRNYLKLYYLPNLYRIRTLELVDMYGNVVMNIPVSFFGRNLLRVAHLRKGIYFLRINRQYVQKLIKG